MKFVAKILFTDTNTQQRTRIVAVEGGSWQRAFDAATEKLKERERIIQISEAGYQ